MNQPVLQGRLDTFRSAALSSPLMHAEFQDRDRNFLYIWGMDYPFANGVMEKSENSVPSESEMDEAIAYFSARNLPFIWWTSAKNLEAKGFQFGGTLKGIVLDISNGIPPMLAPPADLVIKRVQSEADLSTFNALAADVFGLNGNATMQWRALNESVMKGGEQIHFLALLNNEPVGTASLSLSPHSAGVWNLATLPNYRKIGIGAALVYATLSEAKKRKMNHVMALLMPKALAWGVFSKFGFKEVNQFPFYVYGVPSDQLEK